MTFQNLGSQIPMVNWYFNDGGAASGPHDDAAMRDFADIGKVTPVTLVWHAEMEAWMEADQIQARWLPMYRAAAPTPPIAFVTTPRTPSGQLTPVPRSVVTPKAPSESTTQNSGGLLKKFFGRGRGR